MVLSVLRPISKFGIVMYEDDRKAWGNHSLLNSSWNQATEMHWLSILTTIYICMYMLAATRDQRSQPHGNGAGSNVPE